MKTVAFTDDAFTSFLETFPGTLVASYNEILDQRMMQDVSQQNELNASVQPSMAVQEDAVITRRTKKIKANKPRYSTRDEIPPGVVRAVADWFRKPIQAYKGSVNTKSRVTNFVNYRLLGRPLKFYHTTGAYYCTNNLTLIPEKSRAVRVKIDDPAHPLSDYNNKLTSITRMSYILTGSDGTGGRYWYADFGDFYMSIACMNIIYNEYFAN